MGIVFGKSQPETAETSTPPASQPVSFGRSIINWLFDFTREHPIIAGAIGGALVGVSGGIALAPVIVTASVTTVVGMGAVAGAISGATTAAVITHANAERQRIEEAKRIADEKARTARMDALQKEIAEKGQEAVVLHQRAQAAEARAQTQTIKNEEFDRRLTALEARDVAVVVQQPVLAEPESIPQIDPDAARARFAMWRAPRPEPALDLDVDRLTRLAEEIAQQKAM